ncbi:MAG: hypothetical protein KKA79_03680 [Nanoarchaeota archaeon]|nr:hypothetical protein [Nanoarchaeota archaeon]MCG2717687.1 hypothetical protein [Nanoarchaeota archaeon]
MISKKIFIVIIFILLLPVAYSIGISPSSIEIWYEPNKEVSYDYSVRIRQESPQVFMYAKGDLNESITLEQTEAELEPGKWTKFSFTIKFPPKLEPPGLHDNRIGITEASSPSGGGIGVVAGVESILRIRVPYPGRYLELKKFGISTGEVNKPIDFMIELANIGKEDVNDARARIDIKNSKGEVITTLKTEGTPIKKQKTTTLKAQWQTSTPGLYSASGLVIYDENRLEIGEKGFNVGDLIIELINVSAPPILKGEIAKIYADLKSMWNTEIKDVYAELEVKDENGIVVGKSESKTINIPPWTTKNLVLYWDSRNLEVGDYSGKITLHYAEKTDEEMVIIKIKNPSILSILKENILLTAGIIIIVLMLAFNIILVLKKRKNKSK